MNLNNLVKAIRLQDENEVKRIISANSELVNATVRAGVTPVLKIAVANKNTNIVRILLNAGANINKNDATGDTPLLYACYDHNFDMIQLLVQNGANVNTSNKDKETPLNKISRYPGYINAVRLLISAGANVNVKDVYGHTPLRNACENNEIDTVNLLIQAGADVNARDNDGQTPISYSFANIQIVKMLISAGADINVRNNYAETPLLIASHRSYIIDVVKLLISAGADVNAKSSDKGKGVLHNAAFANDIDLLKLFIEAGADVNAKDKKGRTPLQIVDNIVDNPYVNQDRIRIELARLLIQAGAQVHKFKHPVLKSYFSSNVNVEQPSNTPSSPVDNSSPLNDIDEEINEERNQEHKEEFDDDIENICMEFGKRKVRRSLNLAQVNKLIRELKNM